MDREIIVITGDRGAGKSRYCLRLLSEKREDRSAAGIISPAVYTNGSKTGFYTLDVRTNEKKLCGIRTVSEGTIGHWQMDPAVLEWGNELIRSACPCDLLFIDELGPLEFERREGYTAAFDVLRNGQYGAAYVVIRPECLEMFRQFFRDFRIIRIGE